MTRIWLLGASQEDAENPSSNPLEHPPNKRSTVSVLNPENERVAVVSGAGSGIGQAIAVKFGTLGWRVAIGGRRLDRLEQTASLVAEAGGTPFVQSLDVTDPDSVEEFFT